MHIDNPSTNDNRQYDFTGHGGDTRQEYPLIRDILPERSHVIDLGCGNGTLLEILQKEKQISGTGIEISPSGVEICRMKNLNVHQGRIDESLPFENNSFDYAICNVTIQMVMYPETLLREMKRIARYQIISFPNFAFYRNRIQFLFNGVMPLRMLFGYQWFNTGHIHQLSLIDFTHLVSVVGGLRIKEVKYGAIKNPVQRILTRVFPNLFMHIPIILLEKRE